VARLSIPCRVWQGAAMDRRIVDLARDLGLDPESRAYIPYGHDFAKIDTAAAGDGQASGNLIVVSAVTPTPLGEGKTVTSISLGMGLARIGESALTCLRQPSLGPVFGAKGGGAGGGRAQVVPADRINLGGTGDGQAIGAAHNLLAAMLDAHSPRQRAEGRRRPHQLLARHPGQRRQPAQGHHRPRRPAQRRPARVLLRDQRGQRGHGDPRARAGPGRPAAAPRRDRPRA